MISYEVASGISFICVKTARARITYKALNIKHLLQFTNALSMCRMICNTFSICYFLPTYSRIKELFLNGLNAFRLIANMGYLCEWTFSMKLSE